MTCIERRALANDAMAVYLQLSQSMSRITKSNMFQQTILLFVIIGGILIGVESYEFMADSKWIIVMDGIVLTVFSFEVAAKIISEGRQPWKYFMGPERNWNIFDFIIVVFCNPLTTNQSMSMSFLRLMRLFRVAKVFKQVLELQLILMGLMLGLKSMLYIMILLMLLFYLFAIVGVFLFRENDPGNFGDLSITFVSLLRVATLDDWTDLMYINMLGCEVYDGGVYFPANSTQVFPTLIGKYYEFTCVSPQPSPLLASSYFVSFTILSAYLVLSLCVGIITLSMSDALAAQERQKKRAQVLATVSPEWLQDTVNRALGDKRIDATDFEEEKESEGRPRLKHKKSAKKLNRGISTNDLRFRNRTNLHRESASSFTSTVGSHRSFRKRSWLLYLRLSLFCRNLVHSAHFETFMMLTICIAGILVGINTAMDDTDWMVWTDNIILAIFTVEFMLKVFAEGRKPWRYFGNPWNRFDFAICFCSYLPLMPLINAATKRVSSVMMTFRLLRVLRVLKLVQSINQLKIVTEALLKGFSSMTYIMILMLIFFYVFAIGGMLFFQKNDPWHFGVLQDAMISLFRCATLEDWTDIMYINMWGCDRYGYDAYPELCTEPFAWGWVAAVYFVLFAFAGSMVLVKLFLGVVSTGMEQAALRSFMEDELQEEINEAIQKHRITDYGVRLLYSAFMLLDQDDTGILMLDELQVLMTALCSQNFDSETLQLIYEEVDSDRSGGINFAEFLYLMILVKDWNDHINGSTDQRRGAIFLSRSNGVSESGVLQAIMSGDFSCPNQESLSQHGASDTLLAINHSPSSHENLLHVSPLQKINRRKFSRPFSLSATSLQHVMVKRRSTASFSNHSRKSSVSSKQGPPDLSLDIQFGRKDSNRSSKNSFFSRDGSVEFKVSPLHTGMKRSPKSETNLESYCKKENQSPIKKSPSDTSLLQMCQKGSQLNFEDLSKFQYPLNIPHARSLRSEPNTVESFDSLPISLKKAPISPSAQQPFAKTFPSIKYAKGKPPPMPEVRANDNKKRAQRNRSRKLKAGTGINERFTGAERKPITEEQKERNRKRMMHKLQRRRSSITSRNSDDAYSNEHKNGSYDERSSNSEMFRKNRKQLRKQSLPESARKLRSQNKLFTAMRQSSTDSHLQAQLHSNREPEQQQCSRTRIAQQDNEAKQREMMLRRAQRTPRRKTALKLSSKESHMRLNSESMRHKSEVRHPEMSSSNSNSRGSNESPKNLQQRLHRLYSPLRDKQKEWQRSKGSGSNKKKKPAQLIREGSQEHLLAHSSLDWQKSVIEDQEADRMKLQRKFKKRSQNKFKMGSLRRKSLEMVSSMTDSSKDQFQMMRRVSGQTMDQVRQASMEISLQMARSGSDWRLDNLTGRASCSSPEGKGASLFSKEGSRRKYLQETTVHSFGSGDTDSGYPEHKRSEPNSCLHAAGGLDPFTTTCRRKALSSTWSLHHTLETARTPMETSIDAFMGNHALFAEWLQNQKEQVLLLEQITTLSNTMERLRLDNYGLKLKLKKAKKSREKSKARRAKAKQKEGNSEAAVPLPESRDALHKNPSVLKLKINSEVKLKINGEDVDPEGTQFSDNAGGQSKPEAKKAFPAPLLKKISGNLSKQGSGRLKRDPECVQIWDGSPVQSRKETKKSLPAPLLKKLSGTLSKQGSGRMKKVYCCSPNDSGQQATLSSDDSGDEDKWHKPLTLPELEDLELRNRMSTLEMENMEKKYRAKSSYSPRSIDALSHKSTDTEKRKTSAPVSDVNSSKKISDSGDENKWHKPLTLPELEDRELRNRMSTLEMENMEKKYRAKSSYSSRSIDALSHKSTDTERRKTSAPVSDVNSSKKISDHQINLQQPCI